MNPCSRYDSTMGVHYSVRSCAPAWPWWVRKQSKRDYHGTTYTPRRFAVYTWCTLPMADGDWSKHWLGRKGGLPYRNPNACTWPPSAYFARDLWERYCRPLGWLVAGSELYEGGCTCEPSRERWPGEWVMF